ncbi:bifunctional lysylphosphatidylglycerol flippase/synthetase MprF [Mycolicibacterium sphagni]|jgi:lysylphosphatidylglycerol synthetase-like protein (DUF2156 family)|uniref:Phosphatidylglycerol lysyltransferase C-terminal domain-containing protein n=1 Tax=Mycolicibacterium sphagni TaxID=1786 RepID=A0A255DFR8_9MYCO|nr:phosphatidylglycerol lysyltransferase domain-containing protein [Mycolicibacterium sphagni]OYN74453.1 hypothetical protein CG716_28560 [Mycolicibacterium sphagni]
MTEAASRAGGAKAAVARALDRQLLLTSAPSQRLRRIAALVLVGGFATLAALVIRDHDLADWNPSGRLAWSLSLLALVMFLARGISLSRPVSYAHATAATAVLLSGLGAHVLGLGFAGDALVASTGLALMWPIASRPGPDDPKSLWPLIEATRGDPLAAFAMQSTKSLLFTEDRTAALAYRARLGFAVVSGDPVGRPGAYRELVADFVAMCQRQGWRIMVLGCGQRRLDLWRAPGVSQSFLALPIGRDVVVDVTRFTLSGHAFRNLRQAVARTHNRGITTEIIAEQSLSGAQRAELAEVVDAAHRDGRRERGFSMMLDGTLEGHYPGVILAIGRDRDGRVQAFHRYVSSGAGSDVSLDLPWRRPDAPNGIDERLTVDMIAWCRAQGARRLSLAFAPFPELFEVANRTVLQHMYYAFIHLGDPLIRLESLYDYLRKFHAIDRRRYVLVSARHLLWAVLVLLPLEFLPHRASCCSLAQESGAKSAPDVA